MKSCHLTSLETIARTKSSPKLASEWLCKQHPHIVDLRFSRCLQSRGEITTKHKTNLRAIVAVEWGLPSGVLWFLFFQLATPPSIKSVCQCTLVLAGFRIFRRDWLYVSAIKSSRKCDLRECWLRIVAVIEFRRHAAGGISDFSEGHSIRTYYVQLSYAESMTWGSLTSRCGGNRV